MSVQWQSISLEHYIAPFYCEGYRVVENQQYSATFALVDGNTEHDLLEEMLEESKPAKPVDCVIDDYLLYTPFRYPPLLSGTRFGKVTERSPFYGAFELETALAEVAYGKRRFIQDTTAKITHVNIGYTAFCFKSETGNGLDLRHSPFSIYSAILKHPADYTETQSLGTLMREACTEICFYWSARQSEGSNICIFSPKVFTQKTDRKQDQHLNCSVVGNSVIFTDNARKTFVF